MGVKEKPIIFFDGFCGLCDFFVDFILKIDKESIFLFSPLQGQTAKLKLKNSLTNELNSVVIWDNGRFYTKSDAVIYIFQNVGGLWAGIFIFKILPVSIRDYFYSLVSRNRFKVFQAKSICRIPTKEERERFLS